MASLATLAFAVFGSGLGAGFVSDAFLFLDQARLPISTLGDAFVPHGSGFYRPLTELVFAIEFRLFGTDPVPYHVAALIAHLTSAAMIGVICRRLTRSDLAGVTAGATFLFAIQAHEVVYDVADLHNAIGGAVLLFTIYLFIHGLRRAAVVCAALLFFVDETAVLALPLLALYQLLLDRGSMSRDHLQESLRPLIPYAALTAAYLVFRAVFGGFANEVSDPCRTITCLLEGVDQYTKRLFLRPDPWISKEAPVLIVVALVAIAFVLCQPPRQARRVALFGVCWAAGTSLFFILALWPYIADRFLYVPAAGVAVLVASMASGVVDRIARGGLKAIAGAATFAVIAVWISLGTVSLAYRGLLWSGSGEKAARMVEQIHALRPTPPTGVVFYVRGLESTYRPFIEPGSTGPYLFHNGIEPAVRFRFARWDIRVRESSAWSLPKENTIYFVAYTSGTVVAGPLPQAAEQRKLW